MFTGTVASFAGVRQFILNVDTGSSSWVMNTTPTMTQYVQAVDATTLAPLPGTSKIQIINVGSKVTAPVGCALQFTVEGADLGVMGLPAGTVPTVNLYGWGTSTPTWAQWPTTGNPAFTATFDPSAVEPAPTAYLQGFGPFSSPDAVSPTVPVLDGVVTFSNTSTSLQLEVSVVTTGPTPVPTLGDVWGTTYFAVRGPGDTHPLPFIWSGTSLTLRVPGTALEWDLALASISVNQPVVDAVTGTQVATVQFCNPLAATVALPTHPAGVPWTLHVTLMDTTPSEDGSSVKVPPCPT